MKNWVILVIMVFFCAASFAQSSPDTLVYNRHIFTSSVYQTGAKLSNKTLEAKYRQKNVFESERLLNRSKIMLPLGAAIALGGFVTGIDALIGTKHSVYIGNVEHTYYKRPIFQVVGGIGLIAVGVCVMEFGNDAKIKSTKVFNQNEKKNTAKTSVGFLKSGNVGLSLDF